VSRWAAWCAVVALVVGVVGGTAVAGAEADKGGIFRISLQIGAGVDHVDPALAYTAPAWILLDTTCARLMSYPDKPVPAAFQLVPEVAVGFPKVSPDFKTYTFTLRNSFRFSDGKPVRASAFARAINRVLDPRMSSPWVVQLRDVVGAADVLAGRRITATGVTALGNRLVVRFTRAVTDFAARTAMPFMCAVPPTFPIDPEGVKSLPGAGPYQVTAFRPGETVTVRRNRFYGGVRPHHVDGFDVDLRAASPFDMIERIDRGEADWGHSIAGQFFLPPLDLAGKYGLNRSRFFVKPGLTLQLVAFNSSRPLFRDNAALRQAVNFALDRSVLARAPASSATDQLLPFSLPGFRDADLYPLAKPNLERAQALARDNLRGAKAVFYAPDFAVPLAIAQLIKTQLAAIGLEAEIKPVPLHIATAAYAGRLASPGEPWDIATVLWAPPIPEPYAYLNTLLDTRFIGGTNFVSFASAGYDDALRRTARLPQGRDRQLAYGELDVRIARDAAPLAPYAVLSEATFVSERVDRRCIVLRPVLDLAAVCLKQSAR
jgi:peptide/nickel transport system substrate-binding protein